MNLLGIAAMERSHWRQRTRISSLKEEDARTAFFWSKASTRHRKNLVLNVKHNGVAVFGQYKNMEVIWELLNTAMGTKLRRMCASNFSKLRIFPADLSSMEGPFEEEVLSESCNHGYEPSKVPGSDVYNVFFFQGVAVL